MTKTGTLLIVYLLVVNTSIDECIIFSKVQKENT